MGMRELVQDLLNRREDARRMGGEEKVMRQKEKGKLTARERIELLLDPGSFREFGIHGTHHFTTPPPVEIRTPADGFITGYGTMEGRMVAVGAYDFTVMGGSIGAVGEVKNTRLRETALKQRIPVIWLVDSGGARIHEFGGMSEEGSLFAGTGYLFREQVILSGVVPQVAAMVGPGAAGTAYIPALADFVPMVKGTSSMALGGPYLVKAAVGEDVTEEELGGSKVHCEISGCADLEVLNDEECMRVIREYLSYFPSHSGEKPPRIEVSSDANRMNDSILDLVPENPKRAYDVKKVLSLITDHGRFFEMKPAWAKNIVTALTRIGGFSVGIVANNPMFLGGALDINAADKASRFICLCDAFNIPLLFLVDVPGFVVGSRVEKEGIIRHGAKMLHATSDATVPKITVVMRKAYGAGYYVMCGRAYEPDMIVAWPTAEIAVMGPEGMVAIFGRKALESAEDPEKKREELIGRIRKTIDPYLAASWGLIDDIISPAETRDLVIHALRLTEKKTLLRPSKRHSVIPV